jgi:hypothetical protein
MIIILIIYKVEKSFLEQIWILFAGTIYIEWIIKDLIIFKKNPEFIDEINKNIISEWLITARNEAFEKSFNIHLINDFISLFNLDLSDKKLFEVIMVIRNIYWHSRISVNEETIWHTPYSNKLENIKSILDIKWEWSTISINKDNLNFDMKNKVIEELDKNYFPEIAQGIGLNYERIR